MGDTCTSNTDCVAGLYCFECRLQFSGSKCVRDTVTNPFKLVNNSLPFNKYAYLTTHNSFAIVGEPSHTGKPRVTFDNQDDSITDQLNNGVRALMLDTYDFRGEVWLCHSFGGNCYDATAFEPLIDTLKEIETFLLSNPAEIITLILEDYVQAPNGLTKVFNESGLLKYWFPVSKMPKKGKDWPLVTELITKNQRLLVFTSNKTKEKSEGIAYQWKYMVENRYGDAGMERGKCTNREESPLLNDTTKSLILMNYFPTISLKSTACLQNSMGLTDMINTCYDSAGHRWPNFLAVNYYKRSDGGGALKAMDMLNGKILCGCNDIHSCAAKTSLKACAEEESHDQ
ncbi:hypothetical protein LUZ60_006461 [Juncus effusus]|nr:hypothetical protein LUZ60_006461 [Juncus effusus]